MKSAKIKILCLILLISLIFGLCACNSDDINKHLIGILDNGMEDAVLSENRFDYSTLDYQQLQDEYLQIISPINNAAVRIFENLIETGKMISPISSLNPRLTGIRYCYGESIHLYIKGDEICFNETKSEFLRDCYIVIIENIGGCYSSEYQIVRDFINIDRMMRGKDNYVSEIKPLAEAAANAITEVYYGCNKNSLAVTVNPSGDREAIYVTEESKTEHDYLKSFINNYVENERSESPQDWKNIPLCTGGEIRISFSGYNQACDTIRFEYGLGNSNVMLSFDLSDKSVLTEELIKYFAGVYVWGYMTPFDPVPENDEYITFFETLSVALPLKANFITTDFGIAYGYTEETIIKLTGSADF